MSLFQRLRKRVPTEGRDPLEDFLTEAFAWVLESNPGLAVAFARHVTDDPIPDAAVLRWQTQLHLPGVGFVDLVGFVEGGPVLVLEHKVGAKLSDDQVERYRAAMEARHPGHVRTVLITARRDQWTQPAGTQLVWADVYRIVEAWAASHPGVLVDDLLGLLRAEGLAPAAPVTDLGLRAWFDTLSVVPALRALFESLELGDLGLAAIVGTQDPPRLSDKSGRLGLEFPSAPVWRPGLFAGVVLDPADHQCGSSNPALGPDFCLIVDYHLYRGVPSRDAFVDSDEFRQLEARLRDDADGFEVFVVRDQSTDRQNWWHPLHLRRPLLQVLAGATTAEAQAERVASEIRRGFAVLLANGELARLRARLLPTPLAP